MPAPYHLSIERDALRTLQEPLKDRYRAAPETALVTLRAQSHLGEGITCSVRTAGALAEAGLHPASYCVLLQTLTGPTELSTSHVVSR